MKHGRLMKFLFPICTILAITLAVSCGKKRETVPVLDTVVEKPYQELDSTAMYYYNTGKLQWKLESKHMKKVLADTGHVVANPVRLCVYDSLGKETSRILSDSGSTDGPMQQFSVWGNVFVHAQNGVRVKSNKLNWDLKKHLVTSDDYVQLMTVNGDVLRGKGMEAAEDFSWWKFFHDVTGRFPNFKERMDKGEGF
jgi:LPS export ABC transporter protein LptC